MGMQDPNLINLLGQEAQMDPGGWDEDLNQMMAPQAAPVQAPISVGSMPNMDPQAAMAAAMQMAQQQQAAQGPPPSLQGSMPQNMARSGFRNPFDGRGLIGNGLSPYEERGIAAYNSPQFQQAHPDLPQQGAPGMVATPGMIGPDQQGGYPGGGQPYAQPQDMGVQSPAMREIMRQNMLRQMMGAPPPQQQDGHPFLHAIGRALGAGTQMMGAVAPLVQQGNAQRVAAGAGFYGPQALNQFMAGSANARFEQAKQQQAQQIAQQQIASQNMGHQNTAQQQAWKQFTDTDPSTINNQIRLYDSINAGNRTQGYLHQVELQGTQGDRRLDQGDHTIAQGDRKLGQDDQRIAQAQQQFQQEHAIKMGQLQVAVDQNQISRENAARLAQQFNQELAYKNNALTHTIQNDAAGRSLQAQGLNSTAQTAANGQALQSGIAADQMVYDPGSKSFVPSHPNMNAAAYPQAPAAPESGGGLNELLSGVQNLIGRLTGGQPAQAAVPQGDAYPPAPVANPQAAVAGAKSQPPVPLADRIQQLKAAGASKAAAMQQLKAEGYQI